MTTELLLRALVGFLICSGIMTILCILISAFVWYMIRNDLDFEDLEYIDFDDDPEA